MFSPMSLQKFDLPGDPSNEYDGEKSIASQSKFCLHRVLQATSGIFHAYLYGGELRGISPTTLGDVLELHHPSPIFVIPRLLVEGLGVGDVALPPVRPT
jgi:hypothetical protein